jgi:hypothetical protein
MFDGNQIFLQIVLHFITNNPNPKRPQQMIRPTLATLHLLAAASSHSSPSAVPMPSPKLAVQNASFHSSLMYKTCHNHIGNTSVG